MQANQGMRQPTWRNYWGWGSGDMLGAGAQAVITGWLFYFFTTFCGLSAVEAGLILGLPRLLEAISCPLIGYMSDNLRHSRIGRRIGRRRLFLLIVLPLLPSFALLFVTGQTFWYYLAVFIFFELLYTMFLIPWETMAAEMSKDYTEKARFAGARMLVAQGSAILASYLPTLLINQFGGKDSAEPFLWMAIIFGLLFSLVVLIVLLSSWERPYTAEELQQPVATLNWAEAMRIPGRMFRDLSSTLRIRAFRQHLSLYLGGYLSQDIFNTAFPIFVATVLMGTLGATLAISQLMTVMYIAQFLSVMIAIRVVIRVGPVFAYKVAITLFIAATLLYGWLYLQQRAVGAGMGGAAPSPLWLFGPIILAGLGRGTLNFVPWSVYNYLPDVDEAVTGQRREGIFAGVMTMVRKVAQSLAIVATGWLIGLGGYVSPQSQGGQAVVQSDTAIATIAAVMVGGPILMMLLGLWAAWDFRLNAQTHRVLVDEVERLRAGHTEPSSPEAQRVVEELTGWRYADLWGRGNAQRAAAQQAKAASHG